MSCRKCDPQLDPSGPRQGEWHLATRFGDVLARVYKNGRLINDCYEIEAPHRAWRYRTLSRLFFGAHGQDQFVTCTNCQKDAEAYIDDSGGFSVSVQ